MTAPAAVVLRWQDVADKGGIREWVDAEIKRLGPAPRALTLRVDGDSTVELAAGEPDELRMLGPFADTAVLPPANR